MKHFRSLLAQPTHDVLWALCFDVFLTFWRRFNVHTTSFWRRVLSGWDVLYIQQEGYQIYTTYLSSLYSWQIYGSSRFGFSDCCCNFCLLFSLRWLSYCCSSSYSRGFSVVIVVAVVFFSFIDLRRCDDVTGVWSPRTSYKRVFNGRIG